MANRTNNEWYALPDREKFILLFEEFQIPIRIWGKYLYAAGRRYTFDMDTGDLIKVENFTKGKVNPA